ncbi:MAG: HD domain-containing protein [Spirochaetales bacterium]|nr:HD domain-containing protein [Spirochaetales bacterium]MCF7937739.1 HD domain-containing protein [Spirochaetales bacterium]
MNGHNNNPNAAASTKLIRLDHFIGLLEDAGMPVFLAGPEAMDRYLLRRSERDLAFHREGMPAESGEAVYHLVVIGDLVSLARTVEEIAFPGVDEIDAVVSLAEGSAIVSLVDDAEEWFSPLLPAYLQFLYRPADGRFIDRRGFYPFLHDVKLRALRSRKEKAKAAPGHSQTASDTRNLSESVLLSRYSVSEEEDADAAILRQYDLLGPAFSEDVAGLKDDYPAVLQRALLVRILTGERPWIGLEVLKRSGFIERHWPELAAMYPVEHSKEYHPEGDVWTHTLETLRYRKRPELILSLGLLLHDIGKADASEVEGRRFDHHAELGAKTAGRFLSRLGFSNQTREQVYYLVRNHMMPAAIDRLPLFRSERVLDSEEFPLLLELYRCDLSSSYRGPDGYYRACKAYRKYLKNRGNPFRTADGKKNLRRYVAGVAG